MNLRYVTSYDNPDNATFTLRQLYAQIPISDYFFLTIGKREKEYGFAVFHNSSNRLSPKERLLGNIDRLARLAPGLFQLDWIVSSHISMGAFAWSGNSNRWKDSNVGALTEFQFSDFYSGLYFYYERLKFWSLGFNLSRQLGRFRFYSEGIIKQGNEQYYADLLDFDNDGVQFSFTTGFAFEWKYFSSRIEQFHRTEGFTKNEQGKIRELVRSSGDLPGYNKGYFGKNYLGLTVGTSRLGIPNFGVSATNLFSFDSFGGETSMSLSYLHKESVTFGANLVFYYGKESEYELYLPTNFQSIFFVRTSF